jgi:hypothetical protein
MTLSLWRGTFSNDDVLGLFVFGEIEIMLPSSLKFREPVSCKAKYLGLFRKGETRTLKISRDNSNILAKFGNNVISVTFDNVTANKILGRYVSSPGEHTGTFLIEQHSL